MGIQQRVELYNRVVKLRNDGLGHIRISRRLGLSPSTVAEWVYNGVTPQGNYRITKVQPSRELSYILGVVYGDGCCPRNTGKIRLEVKDRDFVEEFSRCLSTILNRKDNPYPIWRRNDGRFVTCGNSVVLHDYISLPLEKQKITIEKNPAEFIRGFSDSDGGVSFYQSRGRNYKECRIVISNSNLELLIYIQALLDKYFHIDSVLRKVRKAGIDKIIKGVRTKTTKPLFNLEINKNQSLVRYLKKIGFAIKRKQEKLEEWYKYNLKKVRIYREEGYKCPYCDAIFSTPQSLGGHVTAVHTSADLDLILLRKGYKKKGK